MNIHDAQTQLEREMYYRRKALEIIEDMDEGEEIDLNEIYRSIADEAEDNYQRAEDNSLRNAWQQDLIDMYRYER